MTVYEETERYVIKEFTRAGKERHIPHFLRTVYWVERLKPGADEALRIAAIAHDIDRAFNTREEQWIGTSVRDETYLREHQEEGARIIGEFLAQHTRDHALIQRVRDLVSHHEVGGNSDQNLIKDADSVSFFENNTEMFIKKHRARGGYARMKEKLDWMFDRITSAEAKAIARPQYEEAIRSLDTPD
jgi:hypothetical protein